jgi:carbon-monoxide dehydrogenase large subunit
MTSVMNAVVDALREVGIEHLDMPASPQRVWKAIWEPRTGEVATRT